jgi:hypothetical protein
MSSLPETVRILGKTWTVRVQSSEGLSMSVTGQVDYLEQRITLLEQHPEQVQDTLLHECIHALDHTLLIQLTEGQVHALTGGLMALLRDNPELVLTLSGLEVADGEATVGE